MHNFLVYILGSSFCRLCLLSCGGANSNIVSLLLNCTSLLVEALVNLFKEPLFNKIIEYFSFPPIVLLHVISMMRPLIIFEWHALVCDPIRSPICKL